MPKHETRATTLANELTAKLSHDEFDSESVKIMLEVFMALCRTLKVSDPVDPMSNTIARTVIRLASEGGRDRDELYKRTLTRLPPNH